MLEGEQGEAPNLNLKDLPELLSQRIRSLPLTGVTTIHSRSALMPSLVSGISRQQKLNGGGLKEAPYVASASPFSGGARNGAVWARGQREQLRGVCLTLDWVETVSTDRRVPISSSRAFVQRCLPTWTGPRVTTQHRACNLHDTTVSRLAITTGVQGERPSFERVQQACVCPTVTWQLTPWPLAPKSLRKS
ncbi:hypothetical protein VTK73DRAFT_6986 [Phialemonium thermophilum]|uniref:Uncharacterized protein n=1 Tax=Phialemonium thermophilum TaxID=223376 RepID=A0ABR3WH55_9PEZI